MSNRAWFSAWRCTEPKAIRPGERPGVWLLVPGIHISPMANRAIASHRLPYGRSQPCVLLDSVSFIYRWRRRNEASSNVYDYVFVTSWHGGRASETNWFRKYSQIELYLHVLCLCKYIVKPVYGKKKIVREKKYACAYKPAQRAGMRETWLPRSGVKYAAIENRESDRSTNQSRVTSSLNCRVPNITTYIVLKLKFFRFLTKSLLRSI